MTPSSFHGRPPLIPPRVTELLESPSYAGAVVERLAQYASTMTGSEGTCVLVSGRRGSDSVAVVAAAGTYTDLVGREFGDVAAEQLASGRLVVRDDAARYTAAAPILVDAEPLGAIEIGRMSTAYAEEELSVLAEIANLVGLATQHAEMPPRTRRRLQYETSELADVLDGRTAYSVGKADEVGLAVAVAEWLGLERAAIVEVELAIRVYGVGVLGVPQDILDKPGELDDDERTLVDHIPGWSAESLARVPGLEVVAMAVLHCRDRWDAAGSGAAVARERTPIVSRVVGACSAYRSLVSDRPFRAALAPTDALAELRADAGNRYDGAVIDAIEKVIDSDFVRHSD
jgi:hypothetical protein